MGILNMIFKETNTRKGMGRMRSYSTNKDLHGLFENVEIAES